MGEEIVLHFELVPGRYVDAELAGHALIAWTRLVREVAKQVAPDEELQVDLVGIPEGSLEFRQIFQWAENVAQSVVEGAADFPHLAKAGKWLGLAIATTALGVGADKLLSSDVQEVRIVADQRLPEETERQVAASPAVQSASEAFYDLLQREPAIAEVGVGEQAGSAPIYSVPREQFAERSGLFAPEQEQAEVSESARTITDEWDVVIVKPAAVSKPRTWRFSRDGVEFSALMNDQGFLAAIRDGRVPIHIQEGVVMHVRVSYRERLVGQLWEVVPQSRKIVTVLSPRVLPASPALPFTDGPKK